MPPPREVAASVSDQYVIAPPAVETVNAPCKISVPALRVSDELVVLVTAADMVIDPDVSIRELPAAKAVTKSVFKIFAEPETFD